MLDLCDRVRKNTSAKINARIDDKIDSNIRFYSTQPKEVLTHRIHELDHEWDIERFLIVNASSLALTGLTLGLLKNQKFLGITGFVLPFLLLHGVQGWCPPVPILRRLGFRTRGEIDCEKFAIKALRGDFDTISPLSAEEADKMPRAKEVFEAVGSSFE